MKGNDPLWQPLRPKDYHYYIISSTAISKIKKQIKHSWFLIHSHGALRVSYENFPIWLLSLVKFITGY